MYDITLRVPLETSGTETDMSKKKSSRNTSAARPLEGNEDRVSQLANKLTFQTCEDSKPREFVLEALAALLIDNAQRDGLISTT